MKKFDIVVYGATGFTGMQAARVLNGLAQEHRLKLALAGRNKGKLERVRDALPHGKAPIEVLVADSADFNALNELTKKSKVVANLAGPFSLYAPLLIERCVANRCDYVDITGEAPFIRRMIDLHHDAAHAHGVRIVPFCGFDSVPSDLGWYFILREWRKKFKKTDEACAKVTGLFQMRGGFNGGTIATSLAMTKTGEMKRLDADPLLLCDPDAKLPPAPKDWRLPKRIKELRAFAAPFFMAPINTRVVRRSQSLFAEEEGTHAFSPSVGVSYEEGLLMKELLPVKSGLISGAAAAAGLLSRSKILVALGEKFLPGPGSGPSEKTMNEGFVKVTYVARGTKGSVLKTRLKADGDPGNRVTVKMLAEAALCLALPEERKKLPDAAGVLTPAFAFRDVLVNRLKSCDIEFEVLS